MDSSVDGNLCPLDTVLERNPGDTTDERDGPVDGLDADGEDLVSLGVGEF